MPWKIALDGIPKQALREMEAGDFALKVQPSMLKHEKVRFGFLSQNTFAEYSLVHYYYGKLFVYGS